MAARDFKVISGGYGVKRWQTEDTTTSGLTGTISPGDVVKRGGTGGNFATPALTGDPEIGTDILIGVTRITSTETSSANGVVDVEQVGAGTIIRGKGQTAGNIDTQSEIDALRGDYVAFDRSAATKAGTLTIDENEGDDPNVHGLQIVSGNPTKGTLDVITNILATIQGSIVGQTMD